MADLGHTRGRELSLPASVVGERGFEPPASATRTLRATGLRYSPSTTETSTAAPLRQSKRTRTRGVDCLTGAPVLDSPFGASLSLPT